MAESSTDLETTTPTGGLSRTLPRLMNTPGAKFVLIGIITVLLLVPTIMVGLIVGERSTQAGNVAGEISRGWGSEQVISGPWIVLPQRDVAVDQNGRPIQDRKMYTVISADDVSVDAKLEVTERKRSIYSTPLYASNIRLTGKFSGLADKLREFGYENVDAGEAFLVVGIGDNAGFRESVEATLNGTSVQFEPGLRGIASPNNYVSWRPKQGSPNVASGIHHTLNPQQLRQNFTFDISLTLNGSRKLAIVPAGQRTEVSMTADWPHPGFEGRFLPDERTITDEGFTASWSVPYLARGIAAVTEARVLPGAQTAFSVDFVEPLKFYQVVTRALKYSIAFFSLVFLAVFIFEVLDPRPFHFIQYVLTGLSMVIFYVLLLALAERIGFDIAYAAAAVSTTALISWYVGQSLARKRTALWLTAVIGGTYLIVWLVLSEAEYALLIGALVAFAAIATTMFVTRNVDWQAKSMAQES